MFSHKITGWYSVCVCVCVCVCVSLPVEPDSRIDRTMLSPIISVLTYMLSDVYWYGNVSFFFFFLTIFIKSYI